jgi:hypothetical protein
MSRLSDLWHGIRSGFDINKMKRDPLGAAGKLALVYGLTTTAAGALAPEWSARQAKWMRSGFGFYDDPAAAPTTDIYGGKEQWAYRGGATSASKSNLPTYNLKGYAGYKPPTQGFLEKSVKGIGGLLASPFEFGNDLRGWYDGKLSWKDVQGRNFGWLNSSSVGDEAKKLLLGRGSEGGSGGGGGNRRTSHRDFRANIPHTTAMNISAAGEGGMYKPGGISQALITGAITPENLRMLGYGSGQVTGSGGQTVDLEDVAAIKTTLRSAIG